MLVCLNCLIAMPIEDRPSTPTAYGTCNQCGQRNQLYPIPAVECETEDPSTSPDSLFVNFGNFPKPEYLPNISVGSLSPDSPDRPIPSTATCDSVLPHEPGQQVPIREVGDNMAYGKIREGIDARQKNQERFRRQVEALVGRHYGGLGEADLRKVNSGINLGYLTTVSGIVQLATTTAAAQESPPLYE